MFIVSLSGGPPFPAVRASPQCVDNLGGWQLLKCDTLVFFICAEVEQDCGILVVLFTEVAKINTLPKSSTYKCLPITNT